MPDEKRRTSDHQPGTRDAAPAETEPEAAAEDAAPTPPRTTRRRWFTVPKFGSAGRGGAEPDPGPERD